MKALVFFIICFLPLVKQQCKYGTRNKLSEVTCMGTGLWNFNPSVEKLIFLNVSGHLDLRDYSLNHTKYIFVSRSSITRASLGYFPELIFLTLFKNQHFPDLTRDFFINTTHINWLSLVANHNKIGETSFHLLTNLTWLHIQNQNFPNLTEVFLQENHNLHELSIKNCHLENIENGAFTKTQEMEILSLNFNKLTHLKLSTFTNLKKLKILELHHNKFVNFDLKQFDGLKSVEVIGLPSLFLKHLTFENLLETFPGLRKFEMNKHDLMKRENVDLIKKLRASGVDIIGTPHDCPIFQTNCTRAQTN